MSNNLLYFKWAVTIAVAYLLIKMIDNYQFFFDLAGTASTILKPFLYGLIIAYLLNPVVTFKEKKLKLHRGWAILSSYGLLLGMIGIFIFFIIPSIASSLIDIVNQIPFYNIEIQKWANELFSGWNWDFLSDPTLLNTAKDYILGVIPKVSELIRILVENMIAYTISVGSSLFKLILAIIISIYFLIDKENVLAFSRKLTLVLFGKRKGLKLIEITNAVNANIGTYIIAKSIDSLCLGTVAYIGFRLLEVPYPLLFGIICGLTNMIPFFGPFIGAAPVILVTLLYDFKTAIWIAIFLLVLQQIEGNIIEPKFIGGRLGLTPLLTLLAVALGGGFFGIPGMILSVPVMGVIKLYVTQFMDKKADKLGLEQ